MTGNHAEVNVAGPVTMPNYTSPRARAKTPTLGDALGNRLRGFWGVTARPGGGTRTEAAMNTSR
jgi:hypothetical protein